MGLPSPALHIQAGAHLQEPKRYPARSLTAVGCPAACSRDEKRGEKEM